MISVSGLWWKDIFTGTYPPCAKPACVSNYFKIAPSLIPLLFLDYFFIKSTFILEHSSGWSSSHSRRRWSLSLWINTSDFSSPIMTVQFLPVFFDVPPYCQLSQHVLVVVFFFYTSWFPVSSSMSSFISMSESWVVVVDPYMSNGQHWIAVCLRLSKEGGFWPGTTSGIHKLLCCLTRSCRQRTMELTFC